MPEQSNPPDPRRLAAREHTSRLREILRAPATAQPVAAPPPPRPITSASGSQTRSPAAEAAPLGISTPPASASNSNIHRLLLIEQCLRRPKGRIAQLVAKTQRLAQINRVLHAFLPVQFHDHITLANLNAKNWVIQTDSSAWATRLRYLLPGLRQQLAQHLGIALPPMRIRIVPPAITPQSPSPARRMTITNATVASLEQAAQHLADEALGAAIRRLAEHARQRKQQS